MNNLVIKNASEPNVEYNAIRGSYGKISYFMTTTNLRDVAENLSLAPQGSLNFNERIQRIVNESRVENEILPYLESNELRFFNSLVCILLPDSNEDNDFWSFDEYQGPDGHNLGIGKLKVAKRVSRVVLDGQHRFAALRKFWFKYRDNLFKEDYGIDHIDVSLVFVVVGNLGKKGNKSLKTREETIACVRNMFAVLNKTARQVDKSTLLLIDDTDIRNVFTRKLISDGMLKELYIKWTGGQNLSDKDPYFTSLQVIKDLITFYLRDIPEVDEAFGEDSGRSFALDKYYEKGTKQDISLKETISCVIQKSHPFVEWDKFINKNRISIKLQPEPTDTTPVENKKIAEIRKNKLYCTVAGQKALYRAIIEVFLQSKIRSEKRLTEVIASADVLLKSDMFSRHVSPENPYLSLLFDSHNRMNHTENVVDCARRIFSIAIGSSASKEAVCAKYIELTGVNDCSVLNLYWDKAKVMLLKI